jgi:hypothetical protein
MQAPRNQATPSATTQPVVIAVALVTRYPASQCKREHILSLVTPGSRAERRERPKPATMAFLFLSYFVSFVFVIRGQRGPAVAGLALSTVLSLAMFLYHATSSLNLNF